MIIDVLQELLRVMDTIEMEFPFLSNVLVGYLFFAFFLTLYALYNIAFGSFWSLFEKGEELELKILRLCWVIVIMVTGSLGFLGTIAYFVWKLKQLRIFKKKRESDFENVIADKVRVKKA